ncbi:MAG: hypothetical protein QW727_01995 [Candidatus Pacearchaeota archaeon]
MSILVRPGNLVFIPAIFLFIILLNNSKFKTELGASVLIIFVVLSLFLFIYISKMPREGLLTYYNPQNPIAWNTLSVFYGFYKSSIPLIPSVFFYSFILGLIIVLFYTSLLFDKILKVSREKEDIEFKSNIFNLLLLLSVMFFYIYN